MNLKGALAAANAFVQAMNKNTASPEEIAKRFKVCSRCPKKALISGATSQISRMVGLVANQNKVPTEFSKWKCGVCECSFVLLLPARTEDLHPDTEAEAAVRPKECWQK